MAVAAEIMKNIVDFPVDRAAESANPRRVSVAFAGIAVIFSVLCAVIAGSIMMGRYEAVIDHLAETQKRDHDEAQRARDVAQAHTQQLMNMIAGLGERNATLSSQIDALRRALEQERADRLEGERRMYRELGK